ncbi:MAG: prepilin-type N-terminal cleavage/methylation domain-containing protein [Synergistaceae bacterium]|nr:prepilin-type N-terminal cleavage/methylation domain-containing protein [Synergistaceae bacterium]
MKKSRAFSLVELLVSSVIASMLLFGLAGTIYLPIRLMQYTDDIDAALSRAELVFSILRTPMEYAGYGLPKDETAYREYFGMPAESPFNWPGPLSVSISNRVDTGRRENASCKITFATETKCRTLSQEVISDDRFKVAASWTPSQLLTEAKNANAETIIQNWFVFGAMMPRCVPARYTGRSTGDGGTIYLSFKFKKPTSEPVSIPENDEIFGLRALECEVRKRDDDFVLYTNDHTGSGWQPRVNGVIDIRFALDRENRLVTVETLTRGAHRYEEAITSDALEEWQKKYSGIIPETSRHYRLAANTAVFELNNF